MDNYFRKAGSERSSTENSDTSNSWASWSTFAKSALLQAQRTIDKALDIGNDDVPDNSSQDASDMKAKHPATVDQVSSKSDRVKAGTVDTEELISIDKEPETSDIVFQSLWYMEEQQDKQVGSVNVQPLDMVDGNLVIFDQPVDGETELVSNELLPVSLFSPSSTNQSNSCVSPLSSAGNSSFTPVALLPVSVCSTTSGIATEEAVSNSSNVDALILNTNSSESNESSCDTIVDSIGNLTEVKLCTDVNSNASAETYENSALLLDLTDSTSTQFPETSEPNINVDLEDKESGRKTPNTPVQSLSRPSSRSSISVIHGEIDSTCSSPPLLTELPITVHQSQVKHCKQHVRSLSSDERLLQGPLEIAEESQKGQVASSLSSCSSSDIEVIHEGSIISGRSSSSSHHAAILEKRKFIPNAEFCEVATQTENATTINAEGVKRNINEHAATDTSSSGDSESKDSVIAQLRQEGEKLSRRQFELSNVIKKLRAKEKELESDKNKVKASLDQKCDEFDRLSRLHVAKEAVELKQAETIRHLEESKRALEVTGSQLREQIEDARENEETIKRALESAGSELSTMQAQLTQSHLETTELANVTREKSQLVSRNESLTKEVERLRSLLDTNQSQFWSTEAQLKAKVSELTEKLHLAESRSSDLDSELAEATMPLSMQIERLQAELKAQVDLAHRQELIVMSSRKELESRLSSALERVQFVTREKNAADSQMMELQQQLESVESQKETLSRDVSLCKAEIEDLETKCDRKLDRLNKENVQLKSQVEALGNDLKSERGQLETERKRNERLTELVNKFQQQQHKRVGSGTLRGLDDDFNNASPQSTTDVMMDSSNSAFLTQSLVDNSYAGDLPEINALDNSSYLMMTRSLTPSSSAPPNFDMQFYHTLRLRETELSQLLEQVEKHDRIRRSLNDEICKLTIKNQELENEAGRVSQLQAELEKVESNYNAVLQMYGEKVEEADELRMDLQDVKDMYRNQIEQLLKKQ